MRESQDIGFLFEVSKQSILVDKHHVFFFNHFGSNHIGLKSRGHNLTMLVRSPIFSTREWVALASFQAAFQRDGGAGVAGAGHSASAGARGEWGALGNPPPPRLGDTVIRGDAWGVSFEKWVQVCALLVLCMVLGRPFQYQVLRKTHLVLEVW